MESGHVPTCLAGYTRDCGVKVSGSRIVDAESGCDPTLQAIVELNVGRAGHVSHIASALVREYVRVGGWRLTVPFGDESAIVNSHGRRVGVE